MFGCFFNPRKTFAKSSYTTKTRFANHSNPTSCVCVFVIFLVIVRINYVFFSLLLSFCFDIKLALFGAFDAMITNKKKDTNKNNSELWVFRYITPRLQYLQKETKTPLWNLWCKKNFYWTAISGASFAIAATRFRFFIHLSILWHIVLHYSTYIIMQWFQR